MWVKDKLFAQCVMRDEEKEQTSLDFFYSVLSIGSNQQLVILSTVGDRKPTRPKAAVLHHKTCVFTYKNISLWKSSSALTSPLFGVGTFPSALVIMSSTGRLVLSNLSTQGRLLRKSARHCFKPACVTTRTKILY